MCGVCGVWEYGASSGSVDESLLIRMRDEMTHRGPDDSGELVFDNARGGFGFRRLSIIDLSAAGHQPMHGCDTRTWLVFNGEIYNHAKLREGLEERGHVYRSKTDSETILHLYEERGLDFVYDIEGDYGIAIWDSLREQLVLVRDRIGVKPLYYYCKDGRFIFASEIKAILQHPAVTPDIDEKALYHYLTFLTTPAPSTLFRNIQKLPAGHLLIVKRDGSLDIRQYWDALPPDKAVKRSDDEHKSEILRLLRDSIGKRMMSDVPFGVFLSGGVDSSANVALMSEQMTRPVDTFTVGFSDAEYLNELESARRIAKQFATNHHEVIISEKEMQDFLPGLVFHQDEPIADPVCVPLYYVSKLARDSGTIVIQVGEGSDEIFSGYENYVRHLRIYENFWRLAENLPLALRRTVANISGPALEATGRKRAAVELIRRLGANEPLFWGGVIVYDEALKPRVLSQRLRERLNGSSSIQVVNKYLKHVENERPNSDFLARMTYLELKLRLPELLLMRVDKITMATSVEARVPFLDHHLVEYALGVPRSLKVEGASGKHILKRALEDILPHDLLYTRKRGFGAPVREWFRSALAEWFDSHVLSSTLRKRDLLDYDFVSKMFTEHRNRSKDWGFHLWALLNLSLWYERWIDRR
ncbi:MAG TPA: asparagine synthase (glutamine-hydrolyzing) [Pyrinomonadaceae bacterium]|nr:asparagine synthase (glutamine-hydrolyzing) [Pyrinomonadaceae bacterium]